MIFTRCVLEHPFVTTAERWFELTDTLTQLGGEAARAGAAVRIPAPRTRAVAPTPSPSLRPLMIFRIVPPCRCPPPTPAAPFTIGMYQANGAFGAVPAVPGAASRANSRYGPG